MLTIAEIKEKIVPLCKKYNVHRAYLFGSYARGKADEKSDVDIRIEGDGSNLRTLLDEAELQDALEQIFKKKVDLMTALPEGDINKIMRNQILRDEVILYEAM